MANPRQRSKARSSKTTARSLSSKRRLQRRQHKAPVMMGPGVLRDGWDAKKTVFQNYEALGLLPSLPVASGSRARAETVQVTELPVVQFGRIVRNEAGEVVDIIMPDEPERPEDATGGRGKPLNEEEEEVRPVQAKTRVARALEDLAAAPSAVRPQHASAAERQWLSGLVAAHGTDWAAMARDRGRNVWQKTEGEIKRAVKRAGGMEAVLREAGEGQGQMQVE